MDTAELLHDVKWKLVYVTLHLAQLNAGMPRFPGALADSMVRGISLFRKEAKKLKKDIITLMKK